MDYTSVETFLNSYKGLLEKYREELDAKNENDNNLFSSISDSFKNENFTSDILRFILDPKSMGNKIYLQEFLKFIGIENKIIDDFLSDLENIEVLREENRIDLLIKNRKINKAIILESKLNNANDQPMQLLRYYKILTTEKNYDVLKIVYLTINPKNPRLTYYEGYGISRTKYRELKESVDSLLFKVFICSGDSTEEFHNFKDYLKVPAISKSDVVKQFSLLLNKIGDKVTMNEMQIIKKIFSNKDSMENAKAFSDLWNNHQRILHQIVYEYFSKKLDSKIWKKEDECFYSKKVNSSEIQLYICPLYHKQDYWTQIGFYAEKVSLLKEKKSTIDEILESTFAKMGITIDDYYNVIKHDNKWYCLEYTYKEEEPLNKYLKNVEKMIEILKTNAEKKL